MISSTTVSPHLQIMTAVSRGRGCSGFRLSRRIRRRMDTGVHKKRKKDLEKGAKRGRKKVLVVAYYFPPIGGSPIQRTLKFVKYLYDYVYEPVVLNTEPDLYLNKYKMEASLLSEIPKEMQPREFVMVMYRESGEKGHLNYPGKFYEYLRIGRPILCFSAEDSFQAEVLKETGLGVNMELYDVEGIKRFLREQIEIWRTGDGSKRTETESIRKYERRRLTQMLAEQFDRLLDETDEEKSFL